MGPQKTVTQNTGEKGSTERSVGLSESLPLAEELNFLKKMVTIVNR